MGKKISLEEANKYAVSLGYTAKSIETNKNSRLIVVCSKHGDFSVSWSNFKFRKSGCPTCKSEKTASSQKIAFEELLDKASKNGFTVHISKEQYKKNYSKKMQIEVTCSCGHRHFKSSFNIRNSQGCIKCRWKEKHPTRITADKLRKKTTQLGYQIRDISLFENSKSKIVVSCPKHGDFETTYNTLDQGHRCYRCSSHGSKEETNLKNYIKDLGLFFESNNRSILNGKELDIIVPDKKIGIEYCGLYWHSEDKKEKNAHKIKHDLCAQKGIQLITIFEDEWLERQDQIKTILKAKLGLLPKIYARKTNIVTLDKKVATEFLDKNHLQGSCAFILALGLEYNGTLVGCATLSNHHRPNRGEAVLSRVCFGDLAIVGGASKLLLSLIGHAREMGYSSLISWSDNRWSNGGLYKELGMTPSHLPSDYSYVKNGFQKRISKQSCQKKNLLKKGATGKTELEMAKSLGYSRIWDCGKIRWTLAL